MQRVLCIETLDRMVLSQSLAVCLSSPCLPPPNLKAGKLTGFMSWKRLASHWKTWVWSQSRAFSKWKLCSLACFETKPSQQYHSSTVSDFLVWLFSNLAIGWWFKPQSSQKKRKIPGCENWSEKLAFWHKKRREAEPELSSCWAGTQCLWGSALHFQVRVEAQTWTGLSLTALVFLGVCKCLELFCARPQVP